MAPRPIRRWGISRSQQLAAKPPGDCGHRVRKLAHRAREPVRLGHHQHIAGDETSEEPAEYLYHIEDRRMILLTYPNGASPSALLRRRRRGTPLWPRG